MATNNGKYTITIERGQDLFEATLDLSVLKTNDTLKHNIEIKHLDDNIDVLSESFETTIGDDIELVNDIKSKVDELVNKQLMKLRGYTSMFELMMDENDFKKTK